MSKQKINPVRGMHDILPETMRRFRRISQVAYEVTQLYGFEHIQTPIMEFSEVFKRSLGDSSDVVNKEMYIFHDRKYKELVLRPENTASIVRAFISNGLQDKLPAKFFYNGPMFRYERPQKGRQRQFHQIGVEMLGAPEPLADIDVIACAYQILCQLGLQNKITLQINSLGDSESRTKYQKELIGYLNDHAHKLSKDSQLRLKNNPLRILDSKDIEDRLLMEEAPKLYDYLDEYSSDRLDQVREGLESLNIPYKINHHLVRGLDYYCHTVFEFVSDELGAQATVLAGGRYDGLVEALGGQDISGCGWAAGIERLAMMIIKPSFRNDKITLIPIGDKMSDKIIKLSYQLRQQGIITDYLYSGSFKKRLNNANQKQARLAIIIGDDELRNKACKIKEMSSGKEYCLYIDKLHDESHIIKDMLIDKEWKLFSNKETLKIPEDLDFKNKSYIPAITKALKQFYDSFYT